jgi:hypothetical protein
MTRLTVIVGGARIDVDVDVDTAKKISRAVAVATTARSRDLDRVIAEQLDRDPEATLDELCAVSRRRRSDVVASRKRVRAAREAAREGPSPASAVPWPRNGTSVEEPFL